MRGLHLKYIKNSYNSMEKNKFIKKWSEELNRCFTKEDTQMTNKHMKKVINSTNLQGT